MSGVDLVALVFVALLGVAAVSDLLTMTIPNKLTVAFAIGFPVVAIIAGLPAASVALHLAAGLGVLAFCFALFAAGWIGGGDAKLAAAIALWLGPTAVLLQWGILASVFGGLLTLALLSARQFPLPLFLMRQPWIERLHHRATGIPYGIALAAAGMAIYPQAEIFTRLVA